MEEYLTFQKNYRSMRDAKPTPEEVLKGRVSAYRTLKERGNFLSDEEQAVLTNYDQMMKQIIAQKQSQSPEVIPAHKSHGSRSRIRLKATQAGKGTSSASPHQSLNDSFISSHSSTGIIKL